MTDLGSMDQHARGRSVRHSRANPVAEWLDEPSDSGRVAAREWLAVLALTVVALILRVYRLGDLPPGLHIDEAFNLLDARAVIEGWRPVFLPANAGRDVLFTYLQAPLLAWFGESATVARLASALVGTLTVPVAWGFVRSLPLPRASRVAFVTAALTALSFWHMHFSRFGIRAVTFPMVVTLVAWAWWKTVEALGAEARVDRRIDRRVVAWLVSCGALLGLAAYTHPAGRFLFVVPVLHALYLTIRTKKIAPISAAAGAVIVAAVVSLPLTSYWIQHPQSFTGHAQEVSVLDGGVPALAQNVLKVGGMFNVAGDPAGWRNLISGQPLAAAAQHLGDASDEATWLRGRPVFDVLTGLLFVAGLCVLLVAAWAGRHWAALLLIWIGVLLVPTVVTDAAPNFSRAIGIIPAVFVAPALAVDLLAHRIDVRWGRVAGFALVGALLLWTGMLAVRDYFVVWAYDPNTPIAFDAEKVALARYVDATRENGTTVYLAPDMADHPTVQVLAAAPPRGFDSAHGLVVSSTDPSTTEYVLATDDPAWSGLQEQLGDALHVEPLGSRLEYRLAVEDVAGLAAVEDLGDRFQIGTIRLSEDLPAEPVALRLRLSQPMVDSRVAIDVGDAVRLVSTSISPFASVTSGSSVSAAPVLTTTVTLVWHVLEAVGADLSAMVHLTTPDGQGWGVGDGGPLGGTYPTSRWQPGELVFDTHVIVANPAPPSGEVEIVVGLYDWRTGERLPVRGPAADLRQDGTAAAVASTTVIHD